MNKPQIISYIEKSLDITPFMVSWIPNSAKLTVLGSRHNGTGCVKIFELSGQSLVLIDEFSTSKSLKCGTFGASPQFERHLATGDFSGKLQIFDLLEENKVLYSVQAHQEVIHAIDGIAGLGIGKGAPEIATGGQDGFIRLWDPRLRDKPVLSLEPVTGSKGPECWAVALGNAFNQTARALWGGFSNGDLRMFDLRASKMLWETKLPNGICDIQFDRKDIEMNKMVVTTLESGIVTFDLRTFHAEKGFAACSLNLPNNTTVWKVKHLPQNRDLCITSSAAGSVHLWKYKYPDKRFRKLDDGTLIGEPGKMELCANAQVATQPIVDFDWCRDKTGLAASVSLDEYLRVLVVTKLTTL